MINKKYNIIYADPPWTYRDKCSSGKRGAEFKYPVLNDEDLQKLNVKEICEKDCILFLWVTMPKLQEGLDLIKAWGFEYKTCAFTWVKKNKKSNSWFWGMGRYSRSNAELCLLVTKGKPKRVSAAVHSIVESPIERHSKSQAKLGTELLIFAEIYRELSFSQRKS